MKQDYFIDQIESAPERDAAKERLAKMVEYGAGRMCRRRFLLDYFGEHLAQDNCGACDHCLAREAPSPVGSAYDGTVTAQKVLSAVIRTGERFGVSYVVDVLRGSRAKRVLELGHDRLSVHGISRDTSKDELIDIVDQLIERGLVARATGEFPTLSVTPMAGSFSRAARRLSFSGGPRAGPARKANRKGTMPPCTMPPCSKNCANSDWRLQTR